MFFSTILPLFPVSGSAADNPAEDAPEVVISVNRDSRYSLYQDYQIKRNQHLADGGVMLHEEYASHHYALKVEKRGVVHYCGAVVNGDRWGEARMERKSEDDLFWKTQMRKVAEKVGLGKSEMEADGM